MNAHEDQVRKIAAAVAEQLGAPIAALLVAPLRELVDQMARARIAALLEQLGTPPPITKSRAARSKVVVSRKAKKPPTTTNYSERRCSKCGTPGFRASGCGRTHNVKAKPKADPDDEDEGSGTDADRRETRSPPSPAQRPATTARRPLPEKPAPISDDETENDEPDDKTPFQLTPAIAPRPRCPHGVTGPCSQCADVAVTRVEVRKDGAVIVGGVVVGINGRRSAERSDPQALRDAALGRPVEPVGPSTVMAAWQAARAREVMCARCGEAFMPRGHVPADSICPRCRRTIEAQGVTERRARRQEYGGTMAGYKYAKPSGLDVPRHLAISADDALDGRVEVCRLHHCPIDEIHRAHESCDGLGTRRRRAHHPES